jgi:hypothetical protein
MEFLSSIFFVYPYAYFLYTDLQQERKMKLIVSGIDFTDLLGYEDALKQLSPQRQLDDLDSFLISQPTGSHMLLIIREANSFAKVTIPVEHWKFSSNSDDNQRIGIVINNARFYHTLHSYSSEQLKEMKIEIETGDTSAFRILMPNDKLSLSHIVMSEAQIKEVLEMMASPEPETPPFDLSLFNDGKEDFINGLVEGMSLIEDSEKKNNAFALYSDRLIVNYNRHVFIYRYDNPVVFMDKDQPLSLHKKIAKMFIALSNKKKAFDAKMLPDNSKVIITSASFKAIMNNSMSNINPPTQESLDGFRPEGSLIGSIKVQDFLDTTQFINGYYLPGKEYNALMISAEEEGIRFTLKDSGVAGFNTCQVDRLMEWSDTVEKGNAEPCSSIIVVESLIAYLKQIDKEEVVQLFMDNKEEHIAVFLSNPKRDIYLAKMSS